MEEGPVGEGACHDTVQECGINTKELAVAGAMVAVLELDRLSGLARRVERKSDSIGQDDEVKGDMEEVNK